MINGENSFLIIIKSPVDYMGNVIGTKISKNQKCPSFFLTYQSQNVWTLLISHLHVLMNKNKKP